MSEKLMNDDLNWQPYQSELHDLNTNMRNWLLYPGSFMQRLREHGANNPQVQVLHQNWQIPFNSERNLLNLDIDATTWVREVLISSGNTPWMYARSIFPRETLEGKLQELTHLENRSLGSILFQDPNLKRSEFEITCLKPGSASHSQVAKQVKITDLKNATLWARRSKFIIEKKELLLTEVFLPAVFQ
jgi:chorismate--pyruvate lyase